MDNETVRVAVSSVQPNLASIAVQQLTSLDFMVLAIVSVLAEDHKLLEMDSQVFFFHPCCSRNIGSTWPSFHDLSWVTESVLQLVTQKAIPTYPSAFQWQHKGEMQPLSDEHFLP